MDCKELIVVKDEPFNDLLPLQVKLPETVFLKRKNQIPGEIIANPQWLPNGWITELKIRKSGLSAGHVDKYYLEPVNGTKFRSKVEVMRFLETGSKHKPKCISNADAQSEHPASGCHKPVYYYRPVFCQSPLYAKHPGLYPVIYFPVIGNSEDRFTNPPMEFLQNFGDLKPIFTQPSNVPSPPVCHSDLFTEAFGPQNSQCSIIPSQSNPCHTCSENVPVEAEWTSVTKKKPRLDCGLAAPNAAQFRAPSSSTSHQKLHPHEYSHLESNPISPNSVALSCNISSFAVDSPSIHVDLQYSPRSVLERHYTLPIASQTKPCNVRMRGQLSPSQLNSFSLNLNSPLSTDLLHWKA